MLRHALLTLLMVLPGSALAVVGGTPVDANDRLYAPLLRVTFDDAPCSGTHLGNGRILTAAHCLQKGDQPIDHANLPKICAWTAGERSLGCAFGFAYEASQPDLPSADLAVVILGEGKLLERVSERDAVEPVFDKLPASEALRIAGQGCDVYWPGFFQGTGSGTYRVGAVRFFRTFGLRHEFLWQPGHPGAGACQGDSGGPLFAAGDDGRMRQYGVAQAIVKPKDGSKKNPKNVVSRYTRFDVDRIAIWLRAVTAK